jgi:hypothetical protein
MDTLADPKFVFISRPYERRAGAMPVRIACVFSWITVILTSIVLAVYAPQLSIWSSVSLFAVLGFAVYTALVTYEWGREDQENYELALDGECVRLLTHDEMQDTAIKQQIWLSDVVGAHFYQRRGTNYLLLRGGRKFLELPLSSFGQEAERQIIDHVQRYRINISGLPGPLVHLRGSAETILTQ